MFSDSALIQFVFANERTDVFWSGIFRTELNRYLFYMLHENYSHTYFIDSMDGKVSVMHYNELDAEAYRTRSTLLHGSQEEQLAKWMLKQLTNKKRRCAVVVKLDVFCRLFGREETILKDIYEKYRRGECFGTIVLAASHNSDKNLPYLMESPVFDHLNENAVITLRGAGRTENIYSYLKTDKQSACVFLNRYTRERIADLVTGIAVSSSELYPGQDTLRCVSNYLTRYLNCAGMRMREQRIFDRDFPFVCPSWQEIYDQLRKKNIWTALCRRSRDYEKAHPDELSDHSVDLICQSAHFIYNDSSIRMKCMKLCVPGALYDNLYDDRTIDDLDQIYMIVRSPNGGKVNPTIAARVDNFIMAFNSALQLSDKDTCARIAAGILLCVRWLTVESDKEILVLEIIHMTEDCARASARLFNLQKQSTGLITAEQKQNINELQSYLKHFDSTFSSLIIDVELSISDVMKNMREVSKGLPLIAPVEIDIDDEDEIVWN